MHGPRISLKMQRPIITRNQPPINTLFQEKETNRHCSESRCTSDQSMALPQLPPPAGHAWSTVFYDDFTGENYSLETNFRHPMGRAKWKWDAASNKEIWWDPASTRLVKDPSSKPVLRVGVWSDWFHRIDRLETKQQFGYGYYESRLRFKGAEGMHSAFWLLPKAMVDDPVAPGEIKGGVEIDVVENRKVDGAGTDIHALGNTAVHWGGYGANHRSSAFKLVSLPGDPAAWATFGVLHFEGGMKWYWGGKEVNSVRVWSPMKNSILFSTEVNESGGWAGKDLGSYGPVESPAGYIEVDYTGFWEQVIRCEDVADSCEDVTESSSDLRAVVGNESAEGATKCAGHVVEDVTDSSSYPGAVSGIESVAGATRCVDDGVAGLGARCVDVVGDLESSWVDVVVADL